MSWQEDYRKKICTIPEALGLIRSGDKIITQFGVAVPCALIEGLYDIRDKVTNVEVNFGITKRVFKVFGKECNGSINVRSSFLYPGEREAIAAGSHMGILPIDLSDTYRERVRYTKPDVALVSVAPPDENGYFSLGLHDVDIHVINQMKTYLNGLIQRTIIPFDTAKHPHARQLMVYMLENDIEDNKKIKPLVLLVS